MQTQLSDALEVLRNFQHSSTTNVSQRKLCNRDACAFILYKCGPTPVRTLRDALAK